jgi:protein-L-isoaspartate(D-aspartate) O-methyltransferase
VVTAILTVAVDRRPQATYLDGQAKHLRTPPTQPVLFTVEFRRKMASLSPAERLSWLVSLAESLADSRRSGVRTSPPRELGEVARGCRLTLADEVERQLGPFDPRFLDALLEVPRERFVRPADLVRSAEDIPLSLDDEGLATISAPHAYLLSFRLLRLKEGDHVAELGAGTGYGAALAAFVVGKSGHVTTFEIDPDLARRARQLLSDLPNVAVVEGDAVESAPRWEGAKKVVATFAVDTLPPAWVDNVPEGGALVAPVGKEGGDQHLWLAERRDGKVVLSKHGAVRYVKNRSKL